jgi:aminoglycoside 2'-N-acetyltransferase I
MNRVPTKQHFRIRIAPSEKLSSVLQTSLRTMLESAYDGDFSDDDWQHALGGVHVYQRSESGFVSHAALISRSIRWDDITLRAGYVEAVATSPTAQRQGLATAILHRINDWILTRYEFGVLSTSAHALYERLGWERWHGASYVDAPSGFRRTRDDDQGLMILRTPRTPPLSLHGTLVADWRGGDVW